MTNFFKNYVFAVGTFAIMTAITHSLLNRGAKKPPIPSQHSVARLPFAAIALFCLIIFSLSFSNNVSGQTLTGFWVLTSQSRILTTNSDDFWVCSNDSVIIEGNWGTFNGNSGGAYWLPQENGGTSYSYNTSYENYIPQGFIFMCANVDGGTVASYNKNKDTIFLYGSDPSVYFYKVIDTLIGGIMISIDTLNHRYIKNTINVPHDSSRIGNVPAFIYADYDTISPDTVSIQKTSQTFYDDTSIAVDTTITRDTMDITIITDKKVTTTITYWQYYFVTTIDSIFFADSLRLDTTTIDTISTKKQTFLTKLLVDTSLLAPSLVIRDTVFGRDTTERLVDTTVNGKDTTINITHRVVVLITKRDTLPDTAVNVIIRDTTVHSGDTTIHIIDTSIVPIIVRDTIINGDSITEVLRDTTIIGADTIIRIFDTTVFAPPAAVNSSQVAEQQQLSYFENIFDFASSDQVRELRIYDMIGRCLFSIQIMPGQTTQSAPYLQSGAYVASFGNQVLKFIRLP